MQKKGPLCSSLVLNALLLQQDQNQHILVSKISYSLSLPFYKFQQQLQL